MKKPVDEKQRHKRLHLLLKGLNKQRKRQARKIDILCNDLIAAQRDFIKRLSTISFTAKFYESILATTDLNSLLMQAGKLVEEQIPDANIAFVLREGRGFELHLSESAQPITLDKDSLENCLNAELVDNICKSNKICTLEDMFAMGLQGNLAVLKGTSAVTIPLGQLGSSLGFILIWRRLENQPSTHQLNNVSAVTAGLSRAIICRRELCRSSD